MTFLLVVETMFRSQKWSYSIALLCNNEMGEPKQRCHNLLDETKENCEVPFSPLVSSDIFIETLKDTFYLFIQSIIVVLR